MPDINLNETPVSVDEFTRLKSATSDSASEGENTYSNYYSMIPNGPHVPMAAAMSNYNPTLGLTAAGGITTDSELKIKEDSPPNSSAGGK